MYPPKKQNNLKQVLEKNIAAQLKRTHEKQQDNLQIKVPQHSQIIRFHTESNCGCKQAQYCTKCKAYDLKLQFIPDKNNHAQHQIKNSISQISLRQPIIINRKQYAHETNFKTQINANRKKFNSQSNKLKSKSPLLRVQPFKPVKLPQRKQKYKCLERDHDYYQQSPKVKDIEIYLDETVLCKHINPNTERETISQKDKYCLKKLFKKIHKFADQLSVCQQQRNRYKLQLQHVQKVHSQCQNQQYQIKRLLDSLNQLKVEVQLLKKEKQFWELIKNQKMQSRNQASINRHPNMEKNSKEKTQQRKKLQPSKNGKNSELNSRISKEIQKRQLSNNSIKRTNEQQQKKSQKTNNQTAKNEENRIQSKQIIKRQQIHHHYKTETQKPQVIYIPGPQKIIQRIVQVPKYIQIQKKHSESAQDNYIRQIQRLQRLIRQQGNKPKYIQTTQTKIVQIQKPIYVDKLVYVQKPVYVDKPVYIQIQKPPKVIQQKIIQKQYKDARQMKSPPQIVHINIPVPYPYQVPIYIQKTTQQQYLISRISELQKQIEQLLSKNRQLSRQNHALTNQTKHYQIIIDVMKKHNQQKNKQISQLLQNSKDYSPLTQSTYCS